MNWTNEGKQFQNAPAGTHVARCIKIIDIGTQEGEYKGERTVARKNIITWELPFELMDNGEPFTVSKFYTASLGEKANLRKDLANWRTRDFTPEELRGFEPKNILDKVCQVAVTLKDNGKTAVTGVFGPPKGVAVPDRFNDLLYFMLDDFEQSTYDKLSDGIKELIKKSAEFDSLGVKDTVDTVDSTPEYTGESGGMGSHVKPVDDDDIPF